MIVPAFTSTANAFALREILTLGGARRVKPMLGEKKGPGG